MNEAILDLESDDTQQNLNNQSGIAIETTNVVDGLECRLSSQTEGAITAYLTDGSGTILERQSIATVEPGETFAFVSELEADETYWVLCDARGREYVRGRAAVEYPIEGESFVATHGIFTGTGSQSSSYRYCIDQIGPASRAEILNLESDEEAQSWTGLDDWSGVRIQATVDIPEFQCRLSAETDGVTTAYLTDDSGSVVDQQSISDLSSGELFSFDSGLEAGESYWIVCDADGDSYVRGRAAADYPVESESLEATNGIHGGGLETGSYRYCLDRIQIPNTEESIGTALDLGSDEEAQSWSGLDDTSGVRIQTTEEVPGLRCRLSEQTDGLITAYLTTDGGDILERQTVSTLEAGDTFTFNTDLEAQEAYRVVCDARGRAYTRGRAPVEYPIQTDSLEATHGIYGGDQQSSSYRYCLSQIAPKEEPDTQATETRGGLVAALTSRPIGVTTVNVVSDPAIDENGDLAAELLAYLAEEDEVNHEFVLPMGSYSWNTEFQLYDPIDYLEIRGDPRATLEIRDHSVNIAFELGTWADDNPPQHVALRNLDIDIADEPERDAGLITAHVGRCLIDNVELVGQRWRHGPEGGERYTCLINTRESDALSLIRNVSFPDGEIADSGEPSVGHSIGFNADPPHEGINLWQQCYIEKYVDNGFYMSNSGGENLVVHGMAVNCGNGSLRIGADDEARDCKVLLDVASEQIYPGAGLWLNGGEPIAERIEIDGSDAQNDIVRINSGADGGDIIDLDVFCGSDVDAPAIRCTYSNETNPSGVLIEDFTVEDVTTANDTGSVRVSRPDITLSSGEVDAANRPALTGGYDPDLDDVDLS